MKNVSKILLMVIVLSAFLLAGCSQPTSTPAATTIPSAAPAQSETVAPTPAAETSDTPLVIYAPASTSSIPVLLAASKMENVQVTLYTNQSQANTLFLRGEVSMLVTGLSVGMDLYKNEVPVQAINSYVSGVSYLVTYGQAITSFADLKGKEIYIPFEGSPIEETSIYFAKQAGLTWKEDITPVYSPFESSIELLKQGKAGAVVLPEPNVSVVEKQPNIYVSLSYFDEWNKNQSTEQGYPQVGAFVNREWAQTHGDDITRFNQALADAILAVQQDPAAAVEAVKTNYKLPAEILLTSLSRTHYTLVTGQEMQNAIQTYYSVIGKPLDENFSAFYYLPVP